MKWLPTGSWCWCWFFGNGIACIIEDRLDLFHRELARVVAQVDRFRRNICRDHLHSWKRPQCSIDGFHTMLTTHFGNGKGSILYICDTFVLLLSIFAIARLVVELDQFFDHRLTLSTGNALRHTGVQMALHQEPFQLLDGLAHRIRLPQDIHTILVLFDHLANPTQVPLNVIESLEDLLLISLHWHTPLLYQNISLSYRYLLMVTGSFMPAS